MNSFDGNISHSTVTGSAYNTNSSCQIDAEFRYTLLPIVYSLVFILGLIGNCYVLWVFKRMTPAKSMTEIKIFMVNLSVADLLFILALPFWVVYYSTKGNWIFGDIPCRVAGCLFFINNYCSIVFLSVISYNRYCAVAYPVETVQYNGRKRGFIISTIIWTVVVGSAIPFLCQRGTNEVGGVTHCFEGYDMNSALPVVIIQFILIGAFFIAFLVTIICNFLILNLLSTKAAQPSRSEKVKKQAFRMVCAVITVFCICFVPHHLVQGPWTLTVLEMWRREDCVFRRAVNDAHQITLSLMGLNCTLDPIIYCFLTKKFRKFLTQRLSRWKSTRRSIRTTFSETNTDGDMALHTIYSA
ncbi:platelet-activating factor receptor [Rhincodon typus]|uniref:platelet-activating factor receptor n=1 Tax=Rhincodon typus TaxID=259920 RepID=UPI0009A3890A|nr:platelet-activating factor receptor [Rhincodon typus]XP_048469250.1 platelet-activating factor receptor [Rhincodon typus]XP_048469251.1 platelet-activating factor receptor [Rhincodon typus]XP_048469252.1 platelet-activating factor receptor [Rhincodon typus]XP_048469253.1 platelet-activating factor receptor [Rhincodon typus]XP_048469254.1 platelet-activating factor receptor [Rhincodon typus]